MNNFEGIIANDDLCSYFVRSIKNNSLPHAFILLGNRGSGKHTLARLVAAALNCENKEEEGHPIPCLECASCKKIMQNNSADVITISREEDRATLGVEPIRFIKEDVAFYPNDGDFKVYIIEDAHTMTTQAQNAFLLTLEEPPSYAVFILLCEHSENILETIKSRAPILRMKAPKKEETIAYLKEKHPSARSFINNHPEEFEQVYMASRGVIGRILELIDSKERKQLLQNRELAARLIEAVANRTLANDFGEISALFSQKRDEKEFVIMQLLEIQAAVRDLLVIKKADNANLIFFTDVEYTERLSYSFSTQRLTEIAESAEKARLALLKNANIKLTLTNFLSDLI